LKKIKKKRSGRPTGVKDRDRVVEELASEFAEDGYTVYSQVDGYPNPPVKGKNGFTPDIYAVRKPATIAEGSDRIDDQQENDGILDRFWERVKTLSLFFMP